MYWQYLGFAVQPFGLTPDPNRFFVGSGHAEALAHLDFVFHHQGGFIVLTGEVGSGKTQVLKTFFNRAPAEAHIAFLINANACPDELLQNICAEFKIPFSHTDSTDKLLGLLRINMLDNFRHGYTNIIVVDEAQHLSFAALEFLRLLTNIETDTQKLLQIILVGQEELATTLAGNELRQLNQRIVARFHLQRLSYQETSAYIDTRIRLSGGIAEIIPQKLHRYIYKHSHGIPRLINLICDRALMGSFALGQPSVSKRIVSQAVHELTENLTSPSRYIPATIKPATIKPATIKPATIKPAAIKRPEQAAVIPPAQPLQLVAPELPVNTTSTHMRAAIADDICENHVSPHDIEQYHNVENDAWPAYRRRQNRVEQFDYFDYALPRIDNEPMLSPPPKDATAHNTQLNSSEKKRMHHRMSHAVTAGYILVLVAALATASWVGWQHRNVLYQQLIDGSLRLADFVQLEAEKTTEVDTTAATVITEKTQQVLTKPQPQHNNIAVKSSSGAAWSQTMPSVVDTVIQLQKIPQHPLLATQRSKKTTTNVSATQRILPAPNIAADAVQPVAYSQFLTEPANIIRHDFDTAIGELLTLTNFALTRRVSLAQIIPEMLWLWGYDKQQLPQRINCHSIDAFGLSCIQLTTSLQMIQKINLPIILIIYNQAKQPNHFLLIGKNDTSWILKRGNTYYAVSDAYLRNSWNNEGYFIIKAPVDSKLTLAPNQTGSSIAWLISALTNIDTQYALNTFTTTYSIKVVASVKRFQRQHGIATTGIAGIETIARINHLLFKSTPELVIFRS